MRYLLPLAFSALSFGSIPSFAADNYTCDLSSAPHMVLAQCAKDLNANLGGESLMALYEENNGSKVPNVCYNTSIHVKKANGNTVVTLTQNGKVQTYSLPGNPRGPYCFREVKGHAGYTANSIDLPNPDPQEKPIVINFKERGPEIAKAANNPECTTAKKPQADAQPFMSLDSGAMTGMREALIKEARAIRGDSRRKNQTFSRCKEAYLAAYAAKGGSKDDLYRSMDEGDSWLFQHMNHPRSSWENQTAAPDSNETSGAAPAGM